MFETLSALAKLVQQLAKSKNVQEKTRNITPEQRRRRIMAHALATPVGSRLKDYQKLLGTPEGGSSPLSTPQRWDEEDIVFRMDPMLNRRAGVKPVRGNMGRNSAAEAKARDILSQYDAGLRVIDRKGRVQAGTSLDAKINERAQRGGGFKKP